MKSTQLRIRGPFKRASLNLSVDAIVIFVLAFSMMGVGLFITKLIRDKSTPLINEAFDLSLLDKQPTSEDPIAVQSALTLKKGGKETVLIGFYNKGDFGTATNILPKIVACVSENGEIVSDADLPVIQALPITVEVSRSDGFTTILKEKKESTLMALQYTCKLAISDATKTFESDQITLKIVS